MPTFSYFCKEFARSSQAHTQCLSFGAVMNDHSQKAGGNPYSPLMCILLLLMVCTATQLKVPAILF